MKQLLFLLLICNLPLLAHGEKGQSIMFDDPEPEPIYLEDSRDTAAEKHAKHCNELLRQVNTLKGKPQRRYAASERYKHECQLPLR